LNALDLFLDKKDGNLVLSVSRLLTKIVRDHGVLKKSLIDRIVPIFSGFIKSNSNRDINPFLIDFLMSLDDDYIKPFVPNYKLFYLKSKDTEKLSMTKIKAFPRLVTEENSIEILNYLFNLLPQSPKLNSLIFATAAAISVKEKTSYLHCISNFELILKADCDKHVCDILENVKVLSLVDNLDLDRDKIVHFARIVLENISVDCLTTKLLSSFLYVLRNFSKDIPDSPYYIEEILSIDKTDWSTNLYSQLLSTSYTVFKHYPPAMQVILAKVFDLILRQNSHELHENAIAYYNLLQSNAQ